MTAAIFLVPDPATARELGGINERLNGQDRVLNEIRGEMLTMSKQMSDLAQFMNQHKGGVRMLVMMMSLAGTIGAGIAWAVSTFIVKPT